MKLVKRYDIAAETSQVYQALIDPQLIEEWSGDRAEMDITSGGLFSLWGGSIHGVNVSVSKETLVQDWKELDWKYYSRVTFNLRKTESGTTLELIHEDIPVESFESIDSGWDDYYLNPLKMLVEGISNNQ